jgi:rhodanese-related sulfurtransferase
MSKKTKVTLISAAVAALALFGGCQDNVSDRDISRVALAEVQRLSKDGPSKVLLLDPRPAESFAQGHLPGAVNLPLDQIGSEKGLLPPTVANPKYVIVYGANPGDGYAIAATKRLLRAGQNGARLFPGGVSEWRGAGLKVDSAAAAGEDKPK